MPVSKFKQLTFSVVFKYALLTILSFVPVTAFAQSQSSVDLAQQMYVAYYGRAGDPGGVNYWAGQFDGSSSLDAVLSNFGNSQEYTDNFGSLSYQALVSGIFQQMFNRNPDSGGLDFYVGRLERGEATLASIAKQVADGTVGDDLQSLENKITAANAFTQFVDSNALNYSKVDIENARILLSTVTANSSTVTSVIDSMSVGVAIAEWVVIDGGISVETATGQFKDSNVEGLSFVSGTQRGVTDAKGNFDFELGRTVTFSIGGVTLGTTAVLSDVTGNLIITPIDLVPNGTSVSTNVLNIIRFLMMLDDDDDPANGIRIVDSVRTIASSWSQLDFNSANFDSALTSIISDAASVSDGVYLLPSTLEARAHFVDSTLTCLYSGAYAGSFNGDDSGSFLAIVDALTGFVFGLSYSPALQELALHKGNVAASFGNGNSFLTGSSSTGAEFEGVLSSYNRLAGTYVNSIFNVSGNFSGVRIGGAANAAFRFTGIYTENAGDDGGLFSFDLDANKNIINGFAYSVEDGTEFNLNGSVSGNSLTVTASNGTSVSGILDTVTGALSGSWDNANGGFSGDFSGSGCRLN